jgi:hypothetical protein
VVRDHALHKRNVSLVVLLTGGWCVAGRWRVVVVAGLVAVLPPQPASSPAAATARAIVPMMVWIRMSGGFLR